MGKTPADQQKSYQTLFDIPMELTILHEIREATNKCWTLGNHQFKQLVAHQLDRRVEPSTKGGARKSRKYLDTLEINRV